MTILPDIDLFPTKRVEDLPQDVLTRKTVLLCVIGSLVWDYIDTILDLSAQMRLKQLRPVSRSVRELRIKYENFQLRSLSRKDLASIERLGLLFEDVCREHLTKLSMALHNEREIRECRDDYRYLVVSVQMAMTLVDTMRYFTADFSRYFSDRGVKGKLVRMPMLKSLETLLPQYAGDAYNPQSPSRKTTAKILFNELKQYENDITDEADFDRHDK